MENLKYTLDQVNGWIRTADQKAMILGSFNITGFIYQLINIDKLVQGSDYVLILGTLSIISTFLALFLWLRILYPKLDNKVKKSKIYFGHIFNAYESDINTGIEELQNISDEEFKKDLASQIIINSIIAQKKYVDIRSFIWVFGIQLLTILFILISIN